MFVLAVIIRLDMPAYQAQRVGFAQSLVVVFAWLDFIGDLTWTHQRFHAYYRGDEPKGYGFAMASLISLLLAFGITSYVLATRVIIKHKDKLVQKKVTGAVFTSLLLLACTDPDAISFFPWKEEAYSKDEAEKDNPLPNRDCTEASMWKILEDVPEFFIQITFFAIGEYDAFTAANLAFTLIMLFYLVMGKLQRMYLVTEEKKENETGIGGMLSRTMSMVGDAFSLPTGEASAAQPPPRRKYVDVLRDLETELTAVFHVDTGKGRHPSEFIEEAQLDVCVDGWDKLENTREKVYAMAESIGVDIKREPPRPLFRKFTSTRRLPSMPGGQSMNAMQVELTPRTQGRMVADLKQFSDSTPRSYGTVVKDLKNVLSERFNLVIEPGQSLADLLEEAQKEVCVAGWDGLPDVKARALALAADLGVRGPSGPGEGGRPATPRDQVEVKVDHQSI